MFGFKDRIDRAVGTLRGYCAKVKNCNKCRFVTQGGECPFMLETPPCDFDMDDRKKKKELPVYFKAGS
jgi:hypothetical protein